VLNNLALVYFSQTRYGEAGPLHKRALEIWEKRYGSQHPQVATSLNNLGELYRAQGKHVLAERLRSPGSPAQTPTRALGRSSSPRYRPG
jgi:hypothetical protein